MSMQGSRRLEVESQIVRPQKQQHLETYTFPYEKRVQAVPYYSIKKRELRAKNLCHRKEEQMERFSEMQSFQKSIDLQANKSRLFYNMITGVSVEPVINDNKFTNFNPELYPLSSTEKVKVVEEKYFPLQNYYNYIWAMKTREEIFRLAEETQKKANEIIKQGHDRSSGKYFEPGVSDDFQQYRRIPILKQTYKIKGNYESRFNSGEGLYKSRQLSVKPMELSPIHLDFNPVENSRRFSNPFSLKEKERQKIIQESMQKSRKM